MPRGWTGGGVHAGILSTKRMAGGDRHGSRRDRLHCQIRARLGYADNRNGYTACTIKVLHLWTLTEYDWMAVVFIGDDCKRNGVTSAAALCSKWLQDESGEMGLRTYHP